MQKSSGNTFRKTLKTKSENLLINERLRLHNVDALRTVAAIGVALYHFLLFNEGGKLVESFGLNDLFFEILRTVVLTFFIVTGIVIPLHSDQNGYQIGSYPRFFLKRLLRVHIPFTALILIILAYDYLRSIKNGSPFVFDSTQFWANFTYTATFQKVHWYNSIFWTLAIEMQFYILAGFLYPLIRKFKLPAIAVYFLIGELLFLFFRDLRYVWAFTPYFTLGFLIYEMYRGKVSATVVTIATFLIAAVVGFLHDLYAVPVAVIVPLICIFAKERPTFLSRLGKYTFSYYLFHGFVGGTLLFLTRNWGNETGMVILRISLAFVTSFIATGIFYWLFEKPSIRLTHRIRYKQR